ncbi:MAG TPA: choice-of-anchor tandem repeat GloVer-containing protein [Rhizomicrobium sp.]|nr:choice-of-anchor tandem repeat GloVer-containing protein [Rhizomicrobium sp.]
MRTIVGLAAAGLLLTIASGAALADPQVKALYQFCHKDICDAGTHPVGGLARDAAGNLYGATDDGNGTVFKVTPGGKASLVHAFCQSCSDGFLPVGDFIMDVDGALYGMTQGGGAGAGGTLFKLTPTHGKTWKFAVLHAFCLEADCIDGRQPFAGLTYDGARSGALYDGVSPLYGTTMHGGPSDVGVAFQLTPRGKKSAKYTVIHGFCDCSDGGQPQTTLLPDGKGAFYGTSGLGGDPVAESGVVFKLAPHGKHFAYSVLHTFCKDGGDCLDGRGGGPLIWDTDGQLVGIAPVAGPNVWGVLYQLAPDGSDQHPLHDFCAQSQCADGQFPNGITLAPDGSIWGTTYLGGGSGAGVLFKYGNGTFALLHSFCANGRCPEGSRPDGLIFDAEGNAYGAASSGGWNADPRGTVYKVAP